MTRNQIHDNFILFLERTRAEQGLTATEMAKKIGIAESTYKNIIYKKTDTIDIAIACRMFDLTHKWMWAMCGYDTTGFEVLDKFTALSTERQELVVKMVQLVSDLK